MLVEQAVLMLIVALTLLGPGIRLDESLPSLRIEDVLLVILLLRLLGRGHVNARLLFLNEGIRPLIIPFAILTFWVAAVSVADLIDTGLGQGSRIAIGLASTTKGPLIAMAILVLAETKGALRRLALVCQIAVVLEVFLLLIEQWDLFGVGRILTDLYRFEAEELYLQVGGRVVGTYGNPNATAVGLAVLCTLASAGSVFHPRRPARAACVGLLVLTTIAVVVSTKSRTGLAGVVTAALVPAAVGLADGRHRKRAVTSLVAGGAILLLSLRAAPEEIAAPLRDRFAVYLGAESLAEEGSFLARRESWANILRSDIFLGRGIGGVLAMITDSGYVTIIVMGGLVGLLMYAAVVLKPVAWIASRLWHSDPSSPNRDIAVAGLACTAVLLVCSVGMVLYGSTRIWATYCIVLGLALSAASRLRATSHPQRSVREPRILLADRTEERPR
jgi:hypothetical protein